MIRQHFNTGGGLDRQLDQSDMPLMTFLPNFLQRRLTAGRPLQAFLVLRHCQANFNALSSAWKVRCPTETRLCGTPNCPNLW